MQVMNNELLKDCYVRLLDSRFSEGVTCDLIECQPGKMILRQGEGLTFLYFLMRGNLGESFKRAFTSRAAGFYC